jgi:glyoxylase-like metal-dependent hydrolase (beta-lactamase superfamily II)
MAGRSLASPLSFKLFDLPQSLPGYGRFLSCWLLQQEGLVAVVDPGPRASTGHLIAALRQRGVRRLDFLLLTHIHLDHGGGAAEVMAAFPEARLYAHPKGRSHLVDPRELWRGSLATIGEVARAYGEPSPVAADRLAGETELERAGIRVLFTPGHAAHHVSFLCGEVLFAGEAVATRIPLGMGLAYQRPATPPRFFPDVFLSSLAALQALEPEPAICAFAHYGIGRGVRAFCREARAQLELWMRVVREHPSDDVPALLGRLESEDPRFALIARLPPDQRERERYYAGNSLRGMRQHFLERK